MTSSPPPNTVTDPPTPADRPVTHVLIALDASGSMRPLAAAVGNGFNAYIDELATDPEVEYRIYVTRFNRTLHVMCEFAPARLIQRLNNDNYRPGGLTALFDAVGTMITQFDRPSPLRRREGDRVILAVYTDGADTASVQYTADDVKNLIAERIRRGWTTLYLHAGADGWHQAADMGFSGDTVIRTPHSGDATQATFTGLGEATRAASRGASAADAATQIMRVLPPPPVE